MGRCKAISKRSRERCRKYASKGHNVCSMHGGKSLRGVESPHFKHGRYSKYLPDRIHERYVQALADKDLINLEDEIALVDARLTGQLDRLHEDGEESTLWGQVMPLVEQRRKLVDTERKRRMGEDRAISIERLMIMVAAIIDIVRRNVASLDTREAIANEIRGLIGNGVET